MASTEPIAIIGTGCRFPGGVSSPARLWSLLQNPRDVASKIPSDRFNIDAYYHPKGSHTGTCNVQESYFLQDDIRAFDAPFFNISAREAESMDPQQRLLLETVYEALEAGGLRLADLQGSSTGVYCGQMCDDYSQVLGRDTENLPQYAATGLARNNTSNRVSYFFDWHGPSMTIDTACSSSLVAVHLAVNALRAGDCNVAVASGTNLILSPTFYISASNLTMLSPTGRSRMWDENADGYARGEGVASIVLKRLGDAIRDGDPIECIVREANINQDGRSMGITMPSSAAQAQLIRSTYAKAGLQLEKAQDRCQYFEAHGTGTQAGDPQEAAAIASSFFPASSAEQDEQKLLVGSIKTVLGHTEGTAGLAGLMKASLCIQNSTIVPNLLFNKLNPKVAPFYSHLEIPTSAQPWPQLPQGTPKRASVNSFGFGGTNAHVILEEYQPKELLPPPKNKRLPVVLPFAFSAISERALGATLNNYREYLETHPGIDPIDMAWSLLARRDQFTHQVTFWASSIEALREEVTAELERRQSNNPSTKVIRSTTPASKCILGIFTGQGAQWPQMGLDLITVCPAAQEWLAELQEALHELPAEYRPKTSLLSELSAAKGASRVDQAAVSQPLCTAVQILLVNYLRELGISFSAVVGHSSGEIAAAYAAGVLTAASAIQIAHLRGQVAQLAGANNQPGAMLAAGLSPEDAEELCEQERFQGRISIAAFNSPSSITLSGDADAVQEMEALLKEQGKFARALKVSTAYHSHHMVACSDAYIKALEGVNIPPSRPTSASWFSSVYGGQEIDCTHLNALAAEYWNDNMLNSVMFTQACTAALQQGSYNMVVEVGPHPALRGPFMQTQAEISNPSNEIPYAGVLQRGRTGVETLATSIGAFWTHLGADSIDVQRYVKLFDRARVLTFVSSLPTYPFDHSQSYYFESRLSKRIAFREDPPNQLLGIRSPEDVAGEWRWRNYLCRDDIDWLDGHRIQSQTVFPATGYVAMALEAARIITRGKTLQLVEVTDFTIETAIALSDDSASVETIFRVDNVKSQGDITTGTFSCQAAIAGTMKRCAQGTIKMAVSEEDLNVLPPRSAQLHRPTDIDLDEFYTYLGELGYGYTGLFRGISSLARQTNASSGVMMNAGLMDSDNQYILHPALMDTLLQTILAAIGVPGDGRLATLHIPTGIDRITVNTGLCGHSATSLGADLCFDAVMTGYGPDGIRGNADLFAANGNPIIHMEGVHVSPLETPVPENARLLFSETVWGPMHPDAEAVYVPLTADQLDNIRLKQKVVLLYMRDILAKVTVEDCSKLDWHRAKIVSWFDHVLSETSMGRHPICQAEWLDESLDAVATQLAGETRVDMLAVHAVAETMLPFLRGETTILETLRQRNLLERLYRELADPAIVTQMAQVAEQIVFRYPRMKIMEVGAGTGSATQAILNRIGRSYHSYTYTDISPGFFEEAQKTFSDHEDRFIYKVFDLEQEPKDQGLLGNSYDLVVAANCIHATACLKDTLTRVRRLLKPGGYLLCLEGTNTDEILASFIFSGFEGWWLGEADGRPWGPMVKAGEWDTILKDSGFAGLDTVTPDDETLLRPFSVFAAQAVDDRIQLLREPLSPAVQAPQHNDLIIIGGTTPAVSSLVAGLDSILGPYFRRTIKGRTMEALDLQDVSMATVLNLADLDSPFFKNLYEARFNALQNLVNASYRFLWITAGPESENPYHGMSKGFLACVGYENPQACFQHLNVVDSNAVEAETVATAVLRMAHNDLDNDYSLSAGVWNIESEVRLENGKWQISRIKSDRGMNNRYMSERRAVYDSVDVGSTNVRIEMNQGSYRLVAQAKSPEDHGSNIQVRVHYSTLRAVRVDGIGFLYLVVGRDEKTQDRVLAFSEINASVVSVRPCWCRVLPSNVPEHQEAEYLRTTACFTVAEYLVRMATPHTSMLLHEVDEVLRKTIATHAMAHNVRPYFSTSRSGNPCLETIYLHEMMPASRLMSLLPRNVSVAAQLDGSANRAFSRVAHILPGNVHVEDSDGLLRSSSLVSIGFDVARGTGVLQTASQLAEQCMAQDQPLDTIDIANLSGDNVSPGHGVQIMNWVRTREVSVRLQPASTLVTLSGQKTYLLVGMTGDLGQSVCRWMIGRGARNIVLTSRNPKVDPWWIDEMAKLGAKVVVMSMDVTNRESILDVDQAIRKHLPPIGGVVNGAMLLNDSLLANMSAEDMQRTFMPKVQGSILLNELYSTIDLDFFILMGSIAGPLGNRAQCAYAAANVFMSGIIQWRRARQLTGSIINPGQILGVGYVSNAGSWLTKSLLNSISCYSMSEQDLHELFAEAILAGCPQSGRNPDIIASFKLESPVERPDVIWYRNPKTWDFIKHWIESASSTGESNTTVPVKVQLESATSEAEVAQIIEEGFIAKLRRKLQLSDEDGITGVTAPIQLGVDSLVAVDLRTWFVKELSVDMSVLRILGGSSIEELSAEVAAKLWAKRDGEKMSN